MAEVLPIDGVVAGSTAGQPPASRSLAAKALAEAVGVVDRTAVERLLQSKRDARMVILFALDEESRPFLRRAAGRTDLDVRTSGMGRRNAEAAIARILEEGRPREVITTGVAGGLNPSLRAGDIVFDTSAAEVAKRLVALGAQRVKFATTESVGVTVEDRRRLREQTGADAVENESGYIQAVCRARGIVCTTIRSISDGADQTMPFDFNKLVGADGNVDYRKVMLALAAEPWKLPGLLKLWETSNLATKNLATFLLRAVPQP